ncbi:type II secretion system protein [Corallincola holothuriorum]|uniref:Type II secretion system protein n=1 Tax=Corallincola holothuriorum TaxID=2282215 RepID=A0A368NK93_9GAMM|nr:type II secretion system protein [Corallincola holothuriorum]RCU49829.1 type II secretion system protein [Corallincola holothuriorum]
MMKQQRGFSLIELVIVVIILGILAVTALPKFLNITDEAEAANIEGIAGGFATGVSLVRAQWEAEGRPNENGVNRIWYDGTQLYLTSEVFETVSPGYPLSKTSVSVPSAVVCLDVWDGILQNPPTITNDPDDLNDVNQKNAFRYLAVTDVDGNDTLCNFYLVTTLNKDGNNEYVPPADETVGNNFQYEPATGRVTININN